MAGGGDDVRPDGAVLDALHGDIRGVISIGIAGALSPLLQVGRCGHRRCQVHDGTEVRTVHDALDGRG